jgi:hypothetical protein
MVDIGMLASGLTGFPPAGSLAAVNADDNTGEENGGDEEDLRQPHDKLFKVTFGDPKNTAALLRAELPEALGAAIDWESLRPEQGSFVDTKFSRGQADLLFSAKVGGREAMLYVLFEHQSTRDPRMVFRLLRYMSRIWEDLSRRRPWPEKLPAILPVVLFQNAEEWDVPGSLAELLDIPPELEGEIGPFVPDFMCRMMQLAGMDYDEIPGTKAGVFVLRAMKAERLGALLDETVWENELIVEVPPEIFQMVLRYMLGADVDKAGFEDRVNRIGNPQLRKDAMTLAQVYRQEGRQEGLQEGLQEGQLNALRAAVLDLLRNRFPEMPDGLMEAVGDITDSERLRALLLRAASCSDMEDFAKGL